MLQHFRKPKWRHAKASVRRQAVDQLAPQDSDAEAVLRELACEDPDAGVRRAAIRKLSDLDLLRERMLGEADASVAEAAAVRYRQILAGGGADADLQRRIGELARCPEGRVLAHVLRGGREEALRLAALDYMDDESVIADAAVNDPVARVRQAAVERLQGGRALHRVMERTRHGDRKIFRLAREKLQAQEAETAAREARTLERQHVLDALEALSQTGAEVSGPALARLENRWQAVAEDADADASNRFGRLLAACRQRLQETPAPQPEPATDLATEWQSCLAGKQPDPDRIEAMLEALDAAAGNPESALPEALAEEAALAARFMGLRDRFAALRGRLEKPDPDGETIDEMNVLLAELRWPDALPRPRTLLDLESLATQPETDSRSQPDVDHTEDYEALSRHLNGVEAALKAGNLREAQRALKQARHVVDGLPGGADSRAERDLRRYTARVAELRDWRRFATLPKQEQLCEQMEALIGADMPPPDLATAIKSLQDAWKETGGSDSAEARQLWARFQAASDRAFEPCRAYFDEQARQREANLAERQRIVEQLESFLDQVDVDAMDIAKLIEIRSKAREEWNHFGPVERRAGKALSRRFEGRMDWLTERIRDGQAQNRRQKAALLERARALGEISPLAARMEEAKSLQSQWREIGPAPPAQERKLFRAFKSACDAVFAERDESRRAERERQEQNRVEAERLCERLEALDGGAGVDEAALMRDLEDAQAQFQALGELPRGVRDGVERRFEKAVRIVRARVAEARERDAEEALERLRRRASLCAGMEAVAQRGGDGAAIRAQWEALAGEEEAVPDALNERWASAVAAAAAGGFSDDAVQAAAARARRLCVGMEILAGLESPAEDRELRMEMQVERLNRGLAAGDSGPEAPEAAVRALEHEWLANGPLPDGAYPDLERRFEAARQAALKGLNAA